MIQEEIHRHRQATDAPVLVLDVPLLIEVGLDRRCDALWYVDAAEDLRRERAKQRGLSVEEMERRERHQSPLDRKRARADLVIVNDGDERSLRSQVRRGLEALGVRSASTA
jgi:dephospho-CoA kinase